MSPEHAPLPRASGLARLRRRTAAAMAVSTVLHAGLALAFVQGWRAARPLDVGGTAMVVTLVAGPLQGGGAVAEAEREAEEAGAAAARTASGPDDTGSPPPRQSAGPPEPAESTSPPASAEAADPPASAVDTGKVEPARRTAAPAEDGPLPPAPDPAVAAPPESRMLAAVPPPPPKPDAPPMSRAPAAKAAAEQADKERPAGAPARQASRHRRQLASLHSGPGDEGITTSGQSDAAAAGASAGPGTRGAAPLAGNPAPAYPARARRRGWQGRVVLEVVVRPDGGVGRVRVLDSSGFAVLDRAARDAVGDWRFTPAARSGRPVRDVIRVPVRFALKGG